MSLRVLLLCLVILSLAVITPTLRTKKPLQPEGAHDFGVTNSEIPLKLAGKFATLTGQTSSTSNLVFDRKLYQIEASATVAPSKLRFLQRSAPKLDPEDETVNYKIKLANAAATPLACGKLDWVENPIVQCWELSPNLAVGYTAAGLTMHWVTPEGKRRIASFAPHVSAEELLDSTTTDVIVSATDSDRAFFVSFVCSDSYGFATVFSFKVDTELGTISEQEKDRQRTLLEKRANIIIRGREFVVVCKLVLEPRSLESTRRFRVTLGTYKQDGELFDGIPVRIVDEITYWSRTPTIDLFTDSSPNLSPMILLYYYRPDTGVLRQIQQGRTSLDSCNHDYYLKQFAPGLDQKQTRHWTWLHSSTDGHPTITHAFLSSKNNLYLIPQKVFNPPPKSDGKVQDQAKYSVFKMVSGEWQLKRQDRRPQNYQFQVRRCTSLAE